ncbi:amino acid ABC transporter substrate-binding protein [Sphingomonas pseudosanguinis]|uniref:amino acid ABC transporter substrate-binding protein n=1 Tax=Sphingomonas pseudosanguinis TaxID=413712 RepID=UPI00160C7F45|nr:amino acid ABC transporter substrate-binding protein [Sphingomonas pseudosanguinis]MBN3535806.1 amino acid ABC transporter substrate-binding protein [Sphingomonas pseudosanguinis]
MRRGTALLAAAALLLTGCSGAPSGSGAASPTGRTLAAVKARGYVRCGSNKDTVGFGAPDDKGYWRGLDVDTCRAVAAAVLGDREKARFVPLTGQQRLTALQTGEIDLLPRTTTWTLQRDANGVNFTIPNFFDYTGFMVRKVSGAKSVRDLSGASVCVQTGSMPEVTFADVSRKYGLNMRAVIFDNVQGTRQAFFSGRCDALITDASALASVRATQADKPDDFIIFPADQEVTPLTPAVRHGDDQWFDVVKFAIQAMIVAEQLGITSSNAEAMRKSDDPTIKRFLGVEPGNGHALGLPDDFAYQVVRQVGNYGEVYDRNVGKDSRLKIPRGLNRLQRDGGLMLPLGFF